MADDISLNVDDPAIQSRRKSPPKRLSFHSRSLSRSSSHHYTHARDFDPILRNLSPTKTLRAFSEPGYLAPNEGLHAALESSTSFERTLGAKAAQTCLDVRSWARELEEWEWPGTFDTPELARKTSEDAGLVEKDVSATTYWGSLPAERVREYEQRSDEIIRQLDDIDVEELKDFVLSAHNQAGSGAVSLEDSIGAIGAATDLRKLDDFTAVITATILQALPYLSRLNRLLDLWTIRLSILRQAPTFLDALTGARADLDHAWAAVGFGSSRDTDHQTHLDFNRGSMIEQQSIIEYRVSSLGRKLDRFLDDLEGRSETVPDSWIEKMETLEQQYADWTVQAERKILENDLRKNRWSRNVSPVVPESKGQVQHKSTESEQMSGYDEALSRRGLLDPPVLSPSSSILSNRPTLADTTSWTSQTTSPTRSYDAATTSMLDLARDDSQTIPSGQAEKIVSMSPVHSNTPSQTPSTASSRARRHVPIILPYDGGDGQEYPTEGITGDLVSRTETPASTIQPSPAAPSSDTPATSFAKRRAMFSGDLERTQSLQRATKSPVRPFEHASNAFARLFKSEALSPNRSRSSSRSDVGSRRSVSNKTENGIIWGGRTPPSPKGSQRKKTADGSPHESQQSRESDPKGVPVAADTDAPPVPVLPPKSPRRSLQSPTKHRVQELAPSPALVEQNKTGSFHEFDFGENWPLTPPELASEHDSLVEAQVARFQAQTYNENEGPGLASPRKPFESDSFDRMFVDSFPGTPDNENSISPTLPDKHSNDTPSSYADQPRAQSPDAQSGVPTMDPSMLDHSPAPVQEAQFEAREALVSTPPNLPKPDHIDLPPTGGLAVPLSSAEGPFTPNSIETDTYSPEIQDARVSYFQMASPPLSRTTSVATTSSPNFQRPLSSQTLSTMRLGNPPTEDGVDRENHLVDDNLTRRASRISLEIKSIDLTRRKSSSSALELDVQSQGDGPSSPVSRKDMSIFPTPPTIHEERPRSPVSPLPGQHGLRHRTSDLSVVSVQTNPVVERGALNGFMNKRRGLGVQADDSPSHARKIAKPETDSFDRHVSEVLQRLPSTIRFRAGATTPQPRPGEARTFSGPRPKLNPRPSSRASGGLTLAPADPSPNRRTPAANEPEVKLYHLTQAGREEPIKLFVRLVGEGERVMVRVGGGWADLADYLRQYAEHHGSRTVSGEVDVKAFGSPPSAGGNSSVHPALRRKASGPLSAEANRAIAGLSSPAMPALERVKTPEKEDHDPALLSSPSRPSLPPRSPSRPSTSDSNRPGSKHSWSEISMAGPGGSGKKVTDLPEQKARWVEGMVERVQKASSEKNDAQKQKHFAELGKVGATRRVIFNRSASGAENGRN
jgi:hypothetical protein